MRLFNPVNTADAANTASTKGSTTLLCLTGLSGVGKTTVRSLFVEHGIPGIYTGDLHPETVLDEKIYYGDRFGQTGFIELVAEAALHLSPNAPLVALDGLRSMNEYAAVCSRAPAYLIGVICAKPARLERLRSRDGGLERLQARDARDLGEEPGSRFNIPRLLCHADAYINTSGRIESIEEQVTEIINTLRVGIGQWK